MAEGYKWDARLDRAAALFNVSCARGLGPARQSEPLPFEDAMAMKWGLEPAVAGGPVNTKAIIVLFTYFLVREIEGAVARRADSEQDWT